MRDGGTVQARYGANRGCIGFEGCALAGRGALGMREVFEESGFPLMCDATNTFWVLKIVTTSGNVTIST